MPASKYSQSTRILRSLIEGIDPQSGDELPTDGVLNRSDGMRASCSRTFSAWARLFGSRGPLTVTSTGVGAPKLITSATMSPASTRGISKRPRASAVAKSASSGGLSRALSGRLLRAVEGPERSSVTMTCAPCAT